MNQNKKEHRTMSWKMLKHPAELQKTQKTKILAYNGFYYYSRCIQLKQTMILYRQNKQKTNQKLLLLWSQKKSIIPLSTALQQEL